MGEAGQEEGEERKNRGKEEEEEEEEEEKKEKEKEEEGLCHKIALLIQFAAATGICSSRVSPMDHYQSSTNTWIFSHLQ